MRFLGAERHGVVTHLYTIRLHPNKIGTSSSKRVGHLQCMHCSALFCACAQPEL